MSDVAIVGAGAAGLAAARRLRAHGLDTLILDAAPHPGGRVRTTRPALLRGAWLDEGAAWLHAPDRNPLVALARARNVPLEEAFAGRVRHLFTEGRRATQPEERAYQRAEQAWRDAVLAHTPPPDRSLADAAGPIRHTDPWAASVEAFESSIIAAADADQLSLTDWHTNELPDGDLQPADGGLGDLLTDLLTTDTGPLQLHTPVTHIDRTHPGHVAVHTASGTVRAAHIIVTVSTGVLRAETIRHTPPLPDATRDAIARLPMGLLSRLVLAAHPDSTDRLDFAPGGEGFIERRLTRPGEPAMFFAAWPRSEPHLVGFHGGRLAWSLAHDHAAAYDFARAELAALYGSTRIDALLTDKCHATDWGADPLFRGAYAYAGPGDFPARAALAQPIDDSRLQFAGEATHTTGLAGTVGGAIQSGEHAADEIIARRKARFTRPA